MALDSIKIKKATTSNNIAAFKNKVVIEKSNYNQWSVSKMKNERIKTEVSFIELIKF